MAANYPEQHIGHHAAPTPSPIGGRSFIDHARLRILLAPVGGISEADFTKWCDYVRSFETIRLVDLPPNCTARRRAAEMSVTGRAAHISTQGSSSSASSSTSPILQTGEIHLSFVTSYDPDHSFLAPFNMHRQVLGALGLATYSSRATNKSELETASADLRGLHPGALIHRVFGFDSGAKRPETMDLSSMKDVVAAQISAQQPSSPSIETSASASSSVDPAAPPDSPGFAAHRDGGLFIFPAVRKDGKDVRFYLKTLLADLVASILDGLDNIVTGLEGTPLETPRETLEGINPHRTSSATTSTSISTSSWLSKTSSAASEAATRASSLFSGFGSHIGVDSGTGTPTSSRPTSAVGGGHHPFDLSSPSSASSTPPSETTRSKILAANANKKSVKRVTSTTGTGPTGSGRYAKVRADLHLLSGNLWDALEGYSSALTALGKERALAGGQDAVWFASALEGFSVARMLASRMGGIVLEKAPCFDLPWTSASAKDKEKEKERDKDGIPRPYAKQSWGEIAEAYTIAVVIYSKCLAPPSVLLEPVRSVTHDSPRDYTHPLIHASACTQYARFLLALWASGGWNGECFDQLVYGGVPPALAENKPTNATYLSLTAYSGIERHDIAAAASSAFSHSILALKATDQITLLSTLTSIFGCIGFSRREAYLLRQLQSTIVGLLVKAKQVHARPPATASLPILQHQHFADKTGEEILGNIVAQTTYDSLGRGPQAVLVLAMQICETYGIHVEVDPLRNVPSWHMLTKATEGLRSAYASPQLGGGGEWNASDLPAPPPAGPDSEVSFLTPMEIANEAPFGWREQQVALLKETISIAELLNDYVAMAFFGAILLRDFYPMLEAQEQKDLMIGTQRSVQAARWAGAQDLAVKYWGPPEILCSLEILSLAPDRMPHERDAEQLSTGGAAADQGVAGLNNAFFWNPSGASAAGKRKAIAVQNEPVEVMATLQNPFAVDLHIDTIKLVGAGAGFLAEDTERVSIPPCSFQTVRLLCTAKDVGKLTIKGITLTLAGGCTEEQTFLLPIYDEPDSKHRQKQAAEQDDRRSRIKVTGLDARSSVIKQRSGVAETKAPSGKWLEMTVVAEQPCLAAFCNELVPSRGLDLYEGETQIMHLELHNLSTGLDVNHIDVTFSDDASEAAKQALLDGELMPQDVYEIEWDLVHQPVLSRPAVQALYIERSASTTLPIRVLGKMGCSNAVIRVEYGHVAAEGGKFWVRRMEVPFRMSVHPVVVCKGLSVAPLKAFEAARLTKECLLSADNVPMSMQSFPGTEVGDIAPTFDGDESTAVAEEVAAEEDDSEYCLVILDISNVHREDVLLRFALNTGGVAPLQMYRVLRAGSTTRLVLPQPRLDLDPRTGTPYIPSTGATAEQAEMFPAIPSIWKENARRQFIVSKVKLSPEEEKAVRRNFWYRQALLKRLGGVWRTLLLSSSPALSHLMGDSEGVEAVRGGKVILRGISSGGGLLLDPVDLVHLQKDPVKVSLSFDGDKAESFITVTASVTNRLMRSVNPIIRLVPTSPGSAQDTTLFDSVIVSDGTYTATKQQTGLKRGEERKVEWGVTFMSPGKYAFLVLVEEPTVERGERLSFASGVFGVTVLPAV